MPSAINSVTSSTLQEGLQRPTAATTSFAQSLARIGARQVEPQRTRLTPEQASAAIREALTEATGSGPSEQTVALLTAQWAHETAHGASMFNYNFGGLKGTGPTGLSVQQKTREGWGTTERQIVDRFRAYESIQDGANDYVRLLTQRYPEAISAAQRGDASGFVRGLKNRGYFTGDEHAYERSVTSISSGLLSGNHSVRPAANGIPGATQDATEKQYALVAHATEYDPATPTLSENHRLRYVEPLVPTALTATLAPDKESTSSTHATFMSEEVSLVSALSMADEVVRAALFQPRTPKENVRRPDTNPTVG